MYLGFLGMYAGVIVTPPANNAAAAAANIRD